MPSLLRPALSHEQFQQRLRAELSSRYPRPAETLLPWANELATVWFTNLDPFRPILALAYPASGRPVVYDPLSVLRSLLLCHQRQFRNITGWVAQLSREPVLAILSGFAPDAVPSVGTFYGFLRRMFPEVRAARVKGIIRPHRRVKKPASGHKLPPDRRKLARLHRWLGHHLDQPLAPTPSELWDQVLTATVRQSVDQGVLSAQGPLRVAGDGSLLRSGAHSHGIKVCGCAERCACPRYFSDPTARVGYDSTNNCFLLGRSAYVLTETGSGHHLPLTLELGPANRADSVSLMLSLGKAHRLLPVQGLTISTVFADSAHDHDPVYRWAVDLGIEPVFDRHGKLSQPSPEVSARLDDAGLNLSEGRPRCAHGFLHSAGHCRTGVRQFQCPKADPQTCSSLACPLRDGKRWTIDIRQQPRLLAPNPKTEPAARKDYKARTNAERAFSLLTSASGLDTARHRRDYVWNGRLAITAVLIHARAWVRSATSSIGDWFRAWCTC